MISVINSKLYLLGAAAMLLLVSLNALFIKLKQSNLANLLSLLISQMQLSCKMLVIKNGKGQMWNIYIHIYIYIYIYIIIYIYIYNHAACKYINTNYIYIIYKYVYFLTNLYIYIYIYI